MVETTLFLLLSFMFGASLGSFALVVIDRLHVRNIVSSRSVCLSCGKELTWKELIPFVSYILQKGRCLNCKTLFGPSHLVIEFIFGLVTALFTYKFFYPFDSITIHSMSMYIYTLVVLTILGVITLYDIKHSLLPSLYLYLFIALSCIPYILRLIAEPTAEVLLAPFFVALPYLLLFLVTKGKGVGFGDVLMFFAVGALLGINKGLLVLLIAVWTGAIVGALFILTGLRKRTDALPFVPFIAFATLLVLFTGISFTGLLETAIS